MFLACLESLLWILQICSYYWLSFWIYPICQPYEHEDQPCLQVNPPGHSCLVLISTSGLFLPVGHHCLQVITLSGSFLPLDHPGVDPGHPCLWFIHMSIASMFLGHPCPGSSMSLGHPCHGSALPLWTRPTLTPRHLWLENNCDLLFWIMIFQE